MRVTVDLTIGANERLEGTATWAGQPEPIAFVGVLQLIGLLESASDPSWTGQSPNRVRPGTRAFTRGAVEP